MADINLDYLKGLGGDDNEFIVEMLQTYKEETGKDMDELRKSLEKKDLQRISFLAHRCKAAYSMLGLQDMMHAAQVIEKTAKAEGCTIEQIQPALEKLLAETDETFKQAEAWIQKLS